MSVFLGVDIGTSGTKTIAIREDGKILASDTIEYPLYSPKPGWSEQNPEDWYQATINSIRNVIAKGKINPSEVKGIGLSGQMHGSVFLDTRQFGGAKVRKTSVSKDGGKTWSPAVEAPELTDPSCMAGLLRYSFDDAGGKGRLIHTGPDSTKRDHGTVWLSTDDGATWPVKRLLFPGGFAYSTPVKLADGTVGVLFEADGYKTIQFARFPVEWITEQPAK